MNQRRIVCGLHILFVALLMGADGTNLRSVYIQPHDLNRSRATNSSSNNSINVNMNRGSDRRRTSNSSIGSLDKVDTTVVEPKRSGAITRNDISVAHEPSKSKTEESQRMNPNGEGSHRFDEADYSNSNKDIDKIIPEKANNTVTELGRPPNLPQGFAENVVEFSLFVALRPHALSVGYILQLVQVVLLNMVSSEQYRFRLGDDQRVVLIDYVLLLQTKQPEIDLIHQSRLLSQIVHRGQNRWWWRYLFRYNVFWADTGGPLSAMRRNEVQTLVEQYIQEAIELHTPTMIELMEELNFHVDDGFRIEVELPSDLNITDPPASSVTELSPPPNLSSGDMGITTTVTTHPCVSCPESSEQSQAQGGVAPDMEHGDNNMVADQGSMKTTGEGSIEGSSPSSDELDDDTDWRSKQRKWDWKRYAGLGMLLVTISGTVCLAQLAALRRSRMNQSELWSNIATEEGVNELLRMGWKIDGTAMEIYDKINLGYRDDDSLFLGGFEQREVSGREITVTQSESTLDGALR